jgi:hypothetical protein
MAVAVDFIDPHIIHVTWPGRVSDPELARLLDDYTRQLSEHDAPYGSLLETTGLPQVTALQRQMIARWMDQQRYRTFVHCKGVALVTTSPLTRGVLTAIIWLARLPLHYEMRTFASRDAALGWLRRQLSGSAARRLSSAP